MPDRVPVNYLITQCSTASEVLLLDFCSHSAAVTSNSQYALCHCFSGQLQKYYETQELIFDQLADMRRQGTDIIQFRQVTFLKMRKKFSSLPLCYLEDVRNSKKFAKHSLQEKARIIE